MHINNRTTVFKFNKLPIHNEWYFPFCFPENCISSDYSQYNAFDLGKRNAVYLHIPFCNMSCNFCPFYHEKPDSENVRNYISALIREINIKLTKAKISNSIQSVAIGGGSPSLLTIRQFNTITEALFDKIDYRMINEYSVELEPSNCSVQLLRNIKNNGVNRVSFGVQTFSLIHRKLLSLSTSIKDIKHIIETALEIFDYVNIDMIFGMPGQTIDELIDDLFLAINMNPTTIDFYPLNIAVSKQTMINRYQSNDRQILSGCAITSYRMIVREYMEGSGYKPTTGFTFAKEKLVKRYKEDSVIFLGPKLIYNDIVFGGSNDYVIGLGAGAFSYLGNINTYNIRSYTKYTQSLFKGIIPCNIYKTRNQSARDLIYFPYRGILQKQFIEFERINPHTLNQFYEAIKKNLIKDKNSYYELTYEGWISYSTLSYYLLPPESKRYLDKQYCVNRKQSFPKE